MFNFSSINLKSLSSIEFSETQLEHSLLEAKVDSKNLKFRREKRLASLLVFIAAVIHLIPSRTQKLSPPAAMVVQR